MITFEEWKALPVDELSNYLYVRHKNIMEDHWFDRPGHNTIGDFLGTVESGSAMALWPGWGEGLQRHALRILDDNCTEMTGKTIPQWREDWRLDAEEIVECVVEQIEAHMQCPKHDREGCLPELLIYTKGLLEKHENENPF